MRITERKSSPFLYSRGSQFWESVHPSGKCSLCHDQLTPLYLLGISYMSSVINEVFCLVLIFFNWHSETLSARPLFKKTFYFRTILDLPIIVEHTKSSYIFCTQFPLLLTSYIRMVHLLQFIKIYGNIIIIQSSSFSFFFFFSDFFSFYLMSIFCFRIPSRILNYI